MVDFDLKELIEKYESKKNSLESEIKNFDKNYRKDFMKDVEKVFEEGKTCTGIAISNVGCSAVGTDKELLTLLAMLIDNLSETISQKYLKAILKYKLDGLNSNEKEVSKQEELKKELLKILEEI